MAQVEFYVSLGLTVEAAPRQYVKSSVDVEIAVSDYSSLYLEVEGLRSIWAKLAREVHLRASKYVSISDQVESFASSWNVLLAAIVDKHIDKYTSSRITVEGMKGQYAQVQPNVEWYKNNWVAQSTFAQNFKDRWAQNSITVESFSLKYVVHQGNVEGYRNEYLKSTHTVEAFKSFYCSEIMQVEASKRTWLGLTVFVRPAIYFDPVGGTYDDWVTVDITMELLPVDARVALDGVEPNVGSAQYLGEDILIRRPKSIWVKAYYADGYIVDRREDYIVPVGGYIIASDDKEVVSIDEDVLWQKQ